MRPGHRQFAHIGALGLIGAVNDIAILIEWNLIHNALQSGSNEFGRLSGNVDPDPLTLKFLGGDTGRRTAAERVEDDIAFIAAGTDYTIQ